MQPSSRTPEGWPNRCPICGKEVRIEPSIPPGDAPCPHCGHLLWFDPTSPERTPEMRADRMVRIYKDIEWAYQHAAIRAGEGDFDLATEVLEQCVLADPGNLTYAQSFVENLQKKYGNNKKGSPLARFKERRTRRAVKEAISNRKWNEVIRSGVRILEINPWDVSTLTALATACENMANDGVGATSARFADCSRFYSKCAADVST